jgi:hypothetical protein
MHLLLVPTKVWLAFMAVPYQVGSMGAGRNAANASKER